MKFASCVMDLAGAKSAITNVMKIAKRVAGRMSVLNAAVAANRRTKMKFVPFMTLYLSICLMVAIPFVVTAQTPAPHPDVPLDKQGAVYYLNCQPVDPIDKMDQVCAVRTDQTSPVELGCIAHTTLDVAVIEVTVERTPHQDAFIRCYATDTEGNVSDISDNAGVADFTPPGKPHVK